MTSTVYSQQFEEKKSKILLYFDASACVSWRGLAHAVVIVCSIFAIQINNWQKISLCEWETKLRGLCKLFTIRADCNTHFENILLILPTFNNSFKFITERNESFLLLKVNTDTQLNWSDVNAGRTMLNSWYVFCFRITVCKIYIISTLEL